MKVTKRKFNTVINQMCRFVPTDGNGSVTVNRDEVVSRAGKILRRII